MDKKLVVCGCVKDCAEYLVHHIQKLKGLQDFFHKVVFVFFENDSTDNTLDILRENGMIVISIQNLPIKGRMNVLAYGRNKLLDFIAENCADFDYMLMTDMDYVLQRFDPAMIKDVFDRYPSFSWDVLTANTFGKYFDIYALRTNQNHAFKDEILFDCWQMINKGRRCGINDEILKREFVGKYQIEISPDTPLIPVLSAFGGMGIYKMSILKDCRYSTAHGCEHVSFHEDIRKNGGRIFICPQLRVCSEQKHIV